MDINFEEIISQIYYYLLVWDKLVIPPFWLILEVFGLASGVHALVNKRDPRAALGWTAVCVFVPGVGALVYWIFGVNRIKSRAKDWHARGKFGSSKHLNKGVSFDFSKHPTSYDLSTFQSLINVSDYVCPLSLMKGCRLKPLYNGEQAYPEMLAAIEAAEKWIFLGTYIFETNEVGKKFVEALGRAQERGVEVRVLVDGIGTRYSRPRIQKILSKREIPYALFLQATLSPRSIHLNLRTHRKIMVVDGKIGFTGGMNIGGRHMVDDPQNKNPTQDIHFKIEGPVLSHLKEAFLRDWYFSLEQKREKDRWPCETEEIGNALCRGIIAGPNEDVEQLRWIINGAFSCAKRNIRIMTPYFIPDSEMTAALITAAMRGVKIEIILPEKNNLLYVKWASQALLEELLEYDIKVYYQPAPFAHSKFLVVDEFYSLIGSANLDPRSLILNFEFNLEVYDDGFSGKLIEHFENTLMKSKIISLEYITKRPFRFQFRDSLAKLFSPYL